MSLEPPLDRSSDPHGGGSDLSGPGDGEQQARHDIAKLFRGFYDDLIRLLRRQLGDGPPAPEDVANQTFYKMLERDRLDDLKDLKAYACAVALNIVRSELRSAKVRNAYADDQLNSPWVSQCDDFDPERVLSAREEIGIVAKTLQQMPERRRRIFMSYRFDGLTPEKAGALEGVSRSSAVRHIAIASAMIVDALALEEHSNNGLGAS
ncbi:MAG: sigma-70 family RNA polymerase sigma factor [Pseudomonadota bacterium]